MDCKKIREIYNVACTTTYSNPYINIQITMQSETLRLQNDLTCLESMKMLEKYCKPENTSK
jgi:hypothetical protein